MRGSMVTRLRLCMEFCTPSRELVLLVPHRHEGQYIHTNSPPQPKTTLDSKGPFYLRVITFFFFFFSAALGAARTSDADVLLRS